MHIDLSLRPELVRGADRVENVDGRTCFHRLPPGMAPFYEAPEGRRVRLRCTAGVRLLFQTDSRFVRLGVEYGACARRLFALDIGVDNEPPRPIGDAQGAAWSETVFEHAEKRLRRFCIWLPHCAEARLGTFEVEDGCRLEPLPMPAKTWLVLGDSISQGMTCTTPAKAVSALLAHRLGCELRNTAVGGERMQAFIGEQTRGIPADAVTIAFGTNDFNMAVGAETFAENARRLLDALLAGRPDFPVGLITPIPWAGRTEPNGKGEPLDAYRQALRAVAPDYPSVRLIEGADVLPDDAEFFVDRVHPNDRGMARYAETLEPHLRHLLGA